MELRVGDHKIWKPCEHVEAINICTWHLLLFLCQFRNSMDTVNAHNSEVYTLTATGTAVWSPIAAQDPVTTSSSSRQVTIVTYPLCIISSCSGRGIATFFKANLDANLPGFGYKFLGLVGVDVDRENLFIERCSQLRLKG